MTITSTHPLLICLRIKRDFRLGEVEAEAEAEAEAEKEEEAAAAEEASIVDEPESIKGGREEEISHLTFISSLIFLSLISSIVPFPFKITSIGSLSFIGLSNFLRLKSTLISSITSFRRVHLGGHSKT